MPAPRKIQRYGWKPDLPDHRDRIYNAERPLTPTGVKLPLKFSLRQKFPKVFDQLELGSCTANAIVGILVAAGMKQGEAELMLSRLFVYYEERRLEGTVHEDAGAEIRTGIKVVASEGAPPESEWPYVISKFDVKPPKQDYSDALHHKAIEYLRVIPGTPGSPVRTPVLAGDGVAFGFAVPEKFESDWDPAKEYLPLPTQDEGFIGGHAVDIIGWDFELKTFEVPVFEVRNSWDDSWGDDGHFWMDCRYVWDRKAGLTSDFWVIQRAS